MIDPKRLAQITSLSDEQLDLQIDAAGKALDQLKKRGPYDRADAHKSI